MSRALLASRGQPWRRVASRTTVRGRRPRKTRRCANEPRRSVAHAAWRSVSSMRKRTFKACICSRNAAISAAMSGGGRSGTGGLNRAADRPFRKTA